MLWLLEQVSVCTDGTEQRYSHWIPQSPAVAGGWERGTVVWGEGAVRGKLSRFHCPLQPQQLHCFLCENQCRSLFLKDPTVFKTWEIMEMEILMCLDWVWKNRKQVTKMVNVSPDWQFLFNASEGSLGYFLLFCCLGNHSPPSYLLLLGMWEGGVRGDT